MHFSQIPARRWLAVLNLVIGCVQARISSRQSSGRVNGTQSEWTSLGCFSDIDTARALDGKSLVNQGNLTLADCFDFCARSGFSYAGVEFGQECYCDHALQVSSSSGKPVDIAECSFPCSGNSTEACGGSDRIAVFNNGEPDPITPPELDNWIYQGCYTDNVTERALVHPMVINAGVTIESCTLACRTTGDFLLAGLEFAGECYCSNALGPHSRLVPDEECHMACLANTSEFCGGQSRLTTYKWSPSTVPADQTCISFNSGAFTLEAIYVDGGSPSAPISLIAGGWPDLSFGVLSACTTCFSFFSFYTMKSGTLLPQTACGAAVGKPLLSRPLAVVEGQSPVFTSVNLDQIQPATSYCVMDNFLKPGAPPVLAANGRSDLWFLCAIETASGRLDLVLDPTDGHDDYRLESCRQVEVQLRA
jgi:hypothetical protein